MRQASRQASRSGAKRRHRRRLALAMILSVLVHGAVLAFAKLNIQLWPGPEDGRAETVAGERFLAQSPLQVVRIADAAAGEEAAADATTEPAAAEAPARLSGSSFRPRPSASAPEMDLAPAERSAEAPTVEAFLARAPAAPKSGRTDLNEGVDFTGASQAAREADRSRRDGGGRSGRGTGGGGISVVISGAGGGCDTPATGIFDRFSGSFGGGGVSRRF